MKVLHLPHSVGGNASGLAEGERALGLASDVLASTKDWLGYPADISLNLQNTKSAFAKAVQLAQTFFAIRSRYDVFHFNFGSSLIHSPQFHLNQLDLPFYPRRAKLFVTYNGCDARQKFPTMRRTTLAACHNPKCYHGMCNYGKYDGFRHKAIAKMSNYVKHIWALNPDLLYFLPPDKSSFLPYSVSIDGLKPCMPQFGKRLTIIHAPTNRETKGTDIILAALQRLQESHGDHINVRLLERVPHAKALEIYRSADLVIDNILQGWYGAVGLENMWLGKPVIARLAKEDLRFLPADMASDLVKTIIAADPRTLYGVLVRCVEDRQLLKDRAQQSLSYARKWHDPKYVASLTKEKYEAA